MGEGVTPFGDSVNLAGAFAQRLMYPGQYADVETGDDTTTLSHNWHRTYDPTLGRYLQSDPIGPAGGLNRYAYAGGNPVGAIDPAGLRSNEGDTSVCAYYENLAASNPRCSYFPAAAKICRGENTLVNGIIKVGMHLLYKYLRKSRPHFPIYPAY